ncbi:MAG: hypothetical protein WCO84_06415, partial [bacterium]
DRSGKDSQAALLVERMRAAGQDPLLVAEPCSDLPTGQLLRKLLKSGEYRESHVGLFFADRMALQASMVVPALEAGRPVVSVRSFLSTICYQQEHHNLAWLYDIHRIMAVKPSHVVILDVDPEESQRRVGRDVRTPEVYERLSIQKRVRERYLNLPQDPRLLGLLRPETKITIIPYPPLDLDPNISMGIVHEGIWSFLGNMSIETQK